VNLVAWVISIAIMLIIVSSTFSLDGSGRRSIMAAKMDPSSQLVSCCNPLFKVVLSLWNGEVVWRRDYVSYRPNDEFIADSLLKSEPSRMGNSFAVMARVVRSTLWLAQADT